MAILEHARRQIPEDKTLELDIGDEFEDRFVHELQLLIAHLGETTAVPGEENFCALPCLLVRMAGALCEGILAALVGGAASTLHGLNESLQA